MVIPELVRGLPPTLDRIALDGLLSEVRARRKEFERQKQISPDIIDRFRTLGIYRALVARRFGGWECSPAEFCRLIEAIAAAARVYVHARSTHAAAVDVMTGELTRVRFGEGLLAPITWLGSCPVRYGPAMRRGRPGSDSIGRRRRRGSGST